jgi:hypothetical protein
MKRVNIGLKDEIHKQAKIISILNDVKLGKYLEGIIEKAVEKDLKSIKGNIKK